MLSGETSGKMFKTQVFLNNHLRIKHQLNIIKAAASFHCGECGAQFIKSKKPCQTFEKSTSIRKPSQILLLPLILCNGKLSE